VARSGGVDFSGGDACLTGWLRQRLNETSKWAAMER
jgi:hypothetical protein